LPVDQTGLNVQFIRKISIDNKSRFGYQDAYGGRSFTNVWLQRYSWKYERLTAIAPIFV
jgi:hypothetical protein